MGARADLMAVDNKKLRSGNVSATLLVHMDFLGASKYWHPGWGPLVVDGQEYQGTGDFIRIPPLPSSVGATAQPAEFGLQAVTQEMISLIRQSKNKVYGRDMWVSMAFFDVTPNDATVQPWTPLFVMRMYTGKMGKPKYTSRYDDGRFTGTVVLPCFGIWNNRNHAANSFWTSASQRFLYPGDGGCDRMGLYASGHEPIWVEGDD